MPSRTGHRRHHAELHRSERAGWLRATVLGANDGILSTGALLLGVVGAGGTRAAVLTAGLAGAAAGAASMAIGEYVSVSSQRDAEQADRATEAEELRRDPEGEHAELRGIYRRRGLSPELADRVATELMAHDALTAHLRDELGLTEELRARPVVAAVASFWSFVLGALVPLAGAALGGDSTRGAVVTAATLVGLLILGGIGAALGGASIPRGSVRVGVGGALALALTFVVGSLVGTAVG
jgi:VIT1/CCC1 family predicted Fe2+/Mn2+ transporter